MPTTFNASTATGAVVTADSSGVLVLQSDGVTALTANGANVTVAGTLTATGGVSGVNLTTGVTGTLPIANGGTNATTAGGALTALGAYPAANPNSYTSNTGTVTSVNLTAGTGVSVSGGPVTSSGAITVTNTAPDQVVSLTGAGTTTITGTYPSFTVTSADSTVGTVTSVGGTGTVNGITLTGTVTASGSLTLGGTLSGVSLTSQVTGTLPVANGGTGATTAGAALTSLGAAASGANIDITSIALTTGTVSTTPANNNDIVNKSYVDTLAASGIHFHQPVRVESPTNLNATYSNGTAGVGATLTNAGTQAALVLDGVTLSVADRVLIYTQTTQTQNGIYVVTSVGSGSTNWVLTRSSDANTYVINSAAGLSEGSTIFVQQGSTGSGETYTCNTSGTITFGTTAISFAQISSAQIYSAGTGLTLTGTAFSITNTGLTANTYGSASSVPVVAFNAQGQATSVTDTSIAIAGSQITSGSVAVAQGGTGATTLTGYVKGTGTSAMTASAAIPVADVTGAAPLASPTFTGTATFATTDALGPVRGNIVAVAALDIDCSLGNFFTKTIAANSTFTFSNAPSTRAFAFTLEVTHTSGTITWPTTVRWPGGTAPTLTTSRVHLITFVTDDAGTNWRAASQINYTA